MHELMLPNEVKISEIKKNGSLSTNNYKKISIKNENQEYISIFLDENDPFKKGIEPGSAAYVNCSEQVFIRNSCLNEIQYSVDKEKYMYLNPNYYDDNYLEDEDILFCTDANIGDCSLFLSEGEKVIISSGMVKLNFKEDKMKYYVMAFMKDGYFREQLNALTPKGATIRHSGDLFLKCKIPIVPETWVWELCESLLKNIAYAEFISNQKLRESESIIDVELIKKKYEYENPSVSNLMSHQRLDAGIYSNTVFQWKKNVINYEKGYTTLEEYGFKLKRGPNLAKRDLGRSIQTDVYRKGYNILIYPSDISSSGYIQKVSYLGARNPIWFLGERDILFSAEGTIGKTFIVCDDKMHFTTNFHGTIISPKSKKASIKKSVFLGLYLNYLRQKGVFDSMAVGANGGSFAVGYWDNILIPKMESNVIDRLYSIYDNRVDIKSTEFSRERLKDMGIYQLNSFLISTKAILTKLCNDIKMDNLQSKGYYEEYTE